MEIIQHGIVLWSYEECYVTVGSGANGLVLIKQDSIGRRVT